MSGNSPNVQDLTRLALAASAQNDAETAIAYLKQATELDAGAAIPRYLLGAEYAQIGIIDRAIAEMTLAVECDPDLATARFQLGLLQLTSAQVAEAAATWAPLEALGEVHPLRLFAAGLLQMVHHASRGQFLIEEASRATPLMPRSCRHAGDRADRRAERKFAAAPGRPRQPATTCSSPRTRPVAPRDGLGR